MPEMRSTLPQKKVESYQWQVKGMRHHPLLHILRLRAASRVRLNGGYNLTRLIFPEGQKAL